MRLFGGCLSHLGLVERKVDHVLGPTLAVVVRGLDLIAIGVEELDRGKALECVVCVCVVNVCS